MTTIYENCDCCGVANPCAACSAACPCTTPPLNVTVTIAGMANNGCLSCAELNDVFVLNQAFNSCHWELDPGFTCANILRLEVDVRRTTVNYTGPPASCECCISVELTISFTDGAARWGGATDFGNDGRIACTTNGSQADINCAGSYDLGFNAFVGGGAAYCDKTFATVNVTI